MLRNVNKMKKISLLLFIFLSFSFSVLYASEFDELDKAPEGAHKGQMLLGAVIFIGQPLGNIITAESTFLENNTYTFEDVDTPPRELWIAHLSFGLGINFEYMPWDHFGFKAIFRYNPIIQRTIFGSNLQNWNGILYYNFEFSVAPTFHITNRKQWDFVIIPKVGYSVAWYDATPIASQLLSDIGYVPTIEERQKAAHGWVVGSEVNFTAYFSGGVFLSLGFDWTLDLFSLDSVYSLTQNGASFFEGETFAMIHSLGFILTVGYAFSN